MTVCVDTSAFLALVNTDDDWHAEASAWFREGGPKDLVTHDLIVGEAAELIRRRRGAETAAEFINDLLPIIEVHITTEHQFMMATAAFRANTARSAPSLVDCMTFQFMRDLGIRDALAFDGHFVDAGFRLVTRAGA